MVTKTNSGIVSKAKLSKGQKEKLKGYAVEIKQLVRQTVMSAIRIGEILLDVKENLLPGQEWQIWVDSEFPGDIHHDSANNFINAYLLFKEYGEEYEEGIKKLPLSSLYIMGRKTTEPEVKETILKLAAEEEPMNREEVKSVIQTYRKLKLAEAGLSNESIDALEVLEIAENPKEIKALSRLSEKKKEAVAELLGSGQADSTKQALRQLKEIRQSEEEVEAQSKIEVHYTGLIEESFKNLQSVPSESVDVAILEAPFKLTYVQSELPIVSLELERILKPGGYVIHFLGHKAIMYAGDALAPLEPLHVICLRKTPGKSKFIVGCNITTSSVLAAFAYKPPYRAPKQMLVDLQTIDDQESTTETSNTTFDVTDTEALPYFDQVPTGIETGIERMMMPLINNESTVLHAILSNSPHFELYSSILQACKSYEVPNLFRVHERSARG